MLEADVDEVEAIVTLWDAGVEGVRDADDVVPPKMVKIARGALGLGSPREQFTVDFWLGLSGMTRNEFVARAAELEVTIAPGTRRIPKNSYRKLRRLFDLPLTVEQVPVLKTAASPEKVEPLAWEPFGTPHIRKYLDEKDLEAIHFALVEDFQEADDPIEPPGIRSRELLGSAAFRTHTSLGNTLKYPTVEFAGAALFHSVILNHAFFNGNKRTAVVTLVVFLYENNITLTCNEEALFELSLRTAQHALVPLSGSDLADHEVVEIAKWIKSHSRLADHSERPMPWLKLKQRLREFGCTWDIASGKGNRLNIYRTVPTTRRGLIRERISQKVLATQVAFAGDGTEAERDVIHKVRGDLELDDKSGIDSSTFYDSKVVDDFIVKYRRLLRWLGRF